MSISVYSVVMAVLWFNAAVLICRFTLYRASSHGLLFVTAILFLSVLRIILPLDLEHSIVIRSIHFYPFVEEQLRSAWIGERSLGILLLRCWAAGSCICLAALCWKLRKARKVSAEARVLAEHEQQYLLDLFSDVCRELGYSGPVSVSVSAKLPIAYQAGLRQPRVVLPCDVCDDRRYSDEDIRNMLRHELCHFLSHDLWIMRGFRFLCCILWWIPATWILSTSVEQMMEIRCDKRVCSHLSATGLLSYFETLKNLAAAAQPERFRVAMDCLGSNQDAAVTQRFRIALQDKPRRRSKAAVAAGYLLCVLLFAASYGVIIQPWGDPSITEEDEQYDLELVVEDDSYILHTYDGKWELYYGHSFYAEIGEDEVNSKPFSELPIINERTK